MTGKKLPLPIAWMKEHERTLVVFGAFVFAGTFLVKEIVGESVKDLKDSISRAEDSFRARTEFMELRERIGQVESRVSRFASDMEALHRKRGIGNGSMPSGDDNLGTLHLPYYQLEYSGMRMPIDDKIRNIEEITEYVKLPEPDAKYFKEDRSFLEILENDAKELDEKKLSKEEKEAKLIHLNGGFMVVDDHLRRLAPGLLTLAKDEVNKQERYYGWCKWLNGLCFIAGLGLAVVGRLYDFKVFGGPE